MELTIMAAERLRYPVPTHVRLRQETVDVVTAYAAMLSTPAKEVKFSDAHRILLDMGCAQVAGLLQVEFKTEQPVPPSLSTVRRRRAKGIPVPGATVARARKVAREQAANRRKNSANESGAA